MAEFNSPKPRLRAKIIAWSFIPTAIILLLVALTTYFAYQQVTQQRVLESDKELTRLSASELSSGYQEYVDRLTALARLPEVYIGDRLRQRAALNNFKNRLVVFDGGVYLLDNLGRVVAVTPENPDLIGDDWSNWESFKNVARSTVTYFSNLEPNGPNGEDVIGIAVPILGNQDEFRGVALGLFRLDVTAVSPFYGTIVKLRIGRTGNAYIIDGNNRVIYASDFNQIGKQFTDHPIASQALNGQVGAERTVSPDGRDIVAGFAPVPRTHWTLIVEENWSDLIRPSLRYRQFLILLLFLGVLIPTIVVTIGVRRITGPIADFIAAAQRISEGDFSQTIKVNTNDELELLSDQFNRMAGHLQESYATLETRVAQRTQELTALNAVAGVVSQSLDLEKILPDALSKTIEVMDMDAGAIFRLDSDGRTLILIAHRGLGQQLIDLVERLPVEDSIVAQVMQSMHPEARSITDYPPGPVRAALEADGWETIVSIPLIAQEKVLGAINVTSRLHQKPAPEALAVPATIGQQIGIAIDNARLYAQSVEYAQQMELARQAAEAANASKSDFLANVSHELRTPLVSILGFARLVQKRLDERIWPVLPPDDDKTRRAETQIEENLDIILAEGQRLTTLINNLLDLEKIEAGKMEWHIQPLAIDEVIQRAAASTASLFEGRPLSLMMDVPGDLPPVQGDPDKLVQVVINLISNAVKFSQQGTVTIRASKDGDGLVVSVIDQGIGIAPSDQERLFEKFTQVGDPMTSKPQGTGLGLSITREIVEHHGGRIWVNSEPGKGSTFTFTLPVPGESGVTETLEPEAEPMRSGGAPSGWHGHVRLT